MLKSKPTFHENVYAFARKIPKGKVATYGQLARMSGNPRAARAVGMLMRNNPDRATVPCHRVVAHNGALTGYAFGKGISTKQSMLVKEGVVFKGARVHLPTSQWNPK